MGISFRPLQRRMQFYFNDGKLHPDAQLVGLADEGKLIAGEKTNVEVNFVVHETWLPYLTPDLANGTGDKYRDILKMDLPNPA